MLYTDVSQGLSILLMFWLFISPVGYQPPQQGLLAKLTAVNPVAPLLLTARDLMTNGSFKYLEGFLWVSGTCLVLLAVAWLLYRLSMPIIIERISA
jgi:lipopolysaccharide transport system permease protein